MLCISCYGQLGARKIELDIYHYTSCLLFAKLGKYLNGIDGQDVIPLFMVRSLEVHCCTQGWTRLWCSLACIGLSHLSPLLPVILQYTRSWAVMRDCVYALATACLVVNSYDVPYSTWALPTTQQVCYFVTLLHLINLEPLIQGKSVTSKINSARWFFPGSWPCILSEERPWPQGTVTSLSMDQLRCW